MIEDINNRSDNKSFARYGEIPYDRVYELCHVLQIFYQAMEWYDGVNENKHPITTLSIAYTKNLSRCHLAIDLVGYRENRRKQEVLKECALWSTTKPFLIQQQKKRKD
ncbi:Agglutinin-like protein 5 [Bienertia sinuspersici]